MGQKLQGLKDIIWAIAVAVCLLALLVGFIFAAVCKHYSTDDISQINLGELNVVNEGKKQQSPEGMVSGTLHELAQSKDAGQEYIDSLTFICDSSSIIMRDAGLLTGGADNRQVWGGSSGTLAAGNLSSAVIKYPNDGSEVSIVNAVMIARPTKLVIMAGRDELSTLNQELFTASFKSLIENIKTASPDTLVICCTIPGVTAAYSGADGLSSQLISQANGWIKQLCTDTGAYYADTASAVCQDGALLSQYADSNGAVLNSAGVEAILDYLRNHALT